MSRRWQILIDTGGTFTDCLAIDTDGTVRRLKVLSTSILRVSLETQFAGNRIAISKNLQVNPSSLVGYPIRSIVGSIAGKIIDASDKEGWLEISGAGDWSNQEIEVCSDEEVPVFAVRLITNTSKEQQLPDIDLRLGSTKGTNALLERKVAKTALIINAGFEDLLLIGTQQRPNIFNLRIEKKRQFYEEVYGLNTRQDYNGVIRVPLTDFELDNIIKKLRGNNIEAVAVAFLNSYKNTSQEEFVQEKLRSAGFKYISLSSQLSPEIKFLKRAETAVVNACLAPIIEDYVEGIQSALTPNSSFEIMSSSGGLHTAERFAPKDSLLSGPAGGIVGAASLAERIGKEKVITLDIGGTSADVAHYHNCFSYKYENSVGDATILSPALDIHTVAAGGGSICYYDGYILRVGPESAGASPGPACYGKGGPLTLTDIALLSGRLSADSSHLPLIRSESEKRLLEVVSEIEKRSGRRPEEKDLIEGFLQIANEKMAEAIKKVSVRKGFDPSEYMLLAFGGAGGQFACDIAEKLSIKAILAPSDGGLLSAVGIGMAKREKFSTRQLLQPLEKTLIQAPVIIRELQEQLYDSFATDGFAESQVQFSTPSYTMRYFGQETPVEVFCDNIELLREQFEEEYFRLMGHTLKREVEVVSVRVKGYINAALDLFSTEREVQQYPKPDSIENIPTFYWEKLNPGAIIAGPALILNRSSTLYIKSNWTGTLDGFRSFRLDINSSEERLEDKEFQEEAQLELFTNRFFAIAEQMGSTLERTSFSVNVKERLDFSCALLNEKAELVVNAPHIPVHLGSLGICVQKVTETLDLGEGDIAITNHPGYGGSHLPDVTLIAPVYHEKTLIGYVANRAHHAEIGGINPGSMPTSAKSLEEEGVVIAPQLIVKNGSPGWSEIENLLTSAKYPTRNVMENIADLKGAVASINTGVSAMSELCRTYGSRVIIQQMQNILDHACMKLRDSLASAIQKPLFAKEFLDSGIPLVVKITRGHDKIIIDFEGTGPVDQGNMNATPAIVNSTVLYVLRLLVGQDIPLNEGLLKDIEIKLPLCLLNPNFGENPAECPAVVGGNTEVSQRLTDLLLKAFNLAACSQGTMNNLVFGNEQFGFYETIGGGTGAGDGFSGFDAVHQHMTNTRITDPEIIEFRYPVEVTRFQIRKYSGGEGAFSGGNGIIRGLKFTQPVVLNLLSQHRKETPYGLKGGAHGKAGEQYLMRSGKKIKLEGIVSMRLEKDDEFVIKTPGGGGFGRH